MHHSSTHLVRLDVHKDSIHGRPDRALAWAVAAPAADDEAGRHPSWSVEISSEGGWRVDDSCPDGAWDTAAPIDSGPAHEAIDRRVPATAPQSTDGLGRHPGEHSLQRGAGVGGDRLRIDQSPVGNRSLDLLHRQPLHLDDLVLIPRGVLGHQTSGHK
jgi:hypothetical protein